MLTRLVLVAAWSPFGFRLGFVWFTFGLRLVSVGPARACLLLFGSLVVRSSGPVLDGVDAVLDA
jgi:hypothetical protein